MSFKSNTVQSNNSNPKSEEWKAQAFLNLWLPSKNGGKRRKLGAIPLRAAKDDERLMLEWLTEDPTRVAAIMSKLTMDFQLVGSDVGFDLN